MVAATPFYRLFTAVSFPCHVHSTDVFNNTSYPCANQLVIIYKENINQTCISTQLTLVLHSPQAVKCNKLNYLNSFCATLRSNNMLYSTKFSKNLFSVTIKLLISRAFLIVDDYNSTCSSFYFPSLIVTIDT